MPKAAGDVASLSVVLLRQDGADVGTEIGRKARRRMCGIDDFRRLALRHERVDQIGLSINMKVCLGLVDKQDRRSLGGALREKRDECHEHAQPCLLYTSPSPRDG